MLESVRAEPGTLWIVQSNSVLAVVGVVHFLLSWLDSNRRERRFQTSLLVTKMPVYSGAFRAPWYLN